MLSPELSLVPFPEADLGTWRAQAADRALRLRHAPMTGEPVELALVAGAAVREELEARLAGGRPGQLLEQVRLGTTPVGWVWTGQDSPDTLVVLDAHLDAPAEHAAALRSALEQRARTAGVRRLELGTAADDPTHRGLVGAGPSSVVATRMVKRLEAEPTSTANPVSLRPMTAAEVADHLETAVEDFAQVRHGADPGRSLEQCREESRAIHARILPAGADTPGHAFLAPEAALEDGTSHARIGLLWLHITPPASYVYDVALDAALRGRGLGRATMLAAESWCARGGAAVLGLNVFADTPTARGLYDSLGYAVVEDHVLIDLTPG